MCYHGEIGTDSGKLKIASAPIICYKAGRNRLFGLAFSPLFRKSFVYKRGRVTKEITLQNESELHMYDYEAYKSVLRISHGYHAYINGYDARELNDDKTPHIFIIPEGTYYYSNEYFIVASQIAWVGKDNAHTKNVLLPKMIRKLSKPKTIKEEVWIPTLREKDVLIDSVESTESTEVSS